MKVLNKFYLEVMSIIRQFLKNVGKHMRKIQIILQEGKKLFIKYELIFICSTWTGKHTFLESY